MKKIISLILILSLVILTSTTFAGNSKPINREKMIKEIVKMGLTIEEAEKLDVYLMKEILKDPDSKIISINTSKFKVQEVDGRMERVEISDDMFTTQGTMPTSDFDLITVVQELESKPSYNEYDRFKFTTIGEWKINPYYEFTDVVTTSWSDDFTISTYSAYAIVDGQESYTPVSLNRVMPETLVAHNWDLQIGKKDEKVIQSVYVYRNPDEVGSANAVGDYAHVVIKPSSVTVGVSSDQTVTFAVTWGSGIEQAEPWVSDFTY